MVRRIVPLVLVLAATALVACQPQRGPKKSGPAVARGDGVVVTADEFSARLKEQSPIIRSRFTTLERKKEFLDGLIRFEVLAAEAERKGLAEDPDILDPTLARAEYQRRLNEHIEAVRAKCQGLGISHVQLSTAQPLELALFDFLKSRANRGKLVMRRSAA